MNVKRICFVFVLALALCFSVAALASELSVEEMSAWVDDVLRRTVGVQPINAPVGEESLTEDGYAFLYDFATLYYDRPELSAQSRLQAVSVTGDQFAAPRGIILGSPQEQLLSAYAQQNPWLMGDGLFAALSRVNRLPQEALWSWAQLDESGNPVQLQCAVHAKTGEDRYTDAGLLFDLEGGLVTGIRVYGLDRTISLTEAEENLKAVEAVQLAISGDAGAAAFSESDFAFSGLDVRTLNIEALEKVLGEKAHTETIADGGESMITAEWEGVYFSGNSLGEMDVLSVTTDRIAGPRGIRTGDELSEVLSVFTGDLEQEDESTLLTCTALLERGGEWVNLSLHLSFVNERLTEWMLYTW